MKETLEVACIGWLGYRNEDLIRSIVLMSKNIEEVVYPIVDSSNTFQTSPLIFDFFDRPVVFRYNQEGPDLINYIKNNILTRSVGVLVNLGGSVVDIDYLQRQEEGDIQYLRAILNVAKRSDLPIVYALNGNIPISWLKVIKEVLNILPSDILMTYDYSQPGTLKQILLKFFEISVNTA